MSEHILCPHCLGELKGGFAGLGACPHCGKGLVNRNPEGALPFGTQLGGKYTVGDYLSADGDGLAYRAVENDAARLNGSENSVDNTSVLQPGDVAFSGPANAASHTFVYVGNIAGFRSNIASASANGTGNYARAPMAGKESLTYSDSTPVRWYRKAESI